MHQRRDRLVRRRTHLCHGVEQVGHEVGAALEGPLPVINGAGRVTWNHTGDVL